MVKLALTMFRPLTLRDISTVTWSGMDPGSQEEKDTGAGVSTDIRGCDIRTSMPEIYHLTLSGWASEGSQSAALPAQ